MKKVSTYLKMRVLGAVESSYQPTLRRRLQETASLAFKDEEAELRTFTEKTIEAWWYRYRKHGITSLQPRADKGKTRKVSAEALLEAIEKAKPHFKKVGSINTKAIYRLCIEKGYLCKNDVSQTSFYRVTKKYDLLKPEDKSNSKSRLAFSKAHANEMWQCDTLHGPYLEIEGKKQQVFLIAFIDDASRVITNAGFYLRDDKHSLLDCFQSALFKRGVPRSVYADNGSNYRCKEFSTICARVGSLLIHTPVRDGASKGKIERFFRTVRDQFLTQSLYHIESLEQLNRDFGLWVENTYHEREHSTLGMKPLDRFFLDRDRIRHLSQNEFCAELFYLERDARIRTDNTFQYKKIRYEAPRDVRNQTVTIRYDRDNSAVYPIIYFNGERLGEALPVDFLHNDRKPLDPIF